MTNAPVALIANRPDTEVAKDLKAELLAKLDEVCLLVDKAHAAGFEVQFAIAPRWDGKRVVQSLVIAKHF